MLGLMHGELGAKMNDISPADHAWEHNAVRTGRHDRAQVVIGTSRVECADLHQQERRLRLRAELRHDLSRQRAGTRRDPKVENNTADSREAGSI
jgi:hypothetical protein